MQTTVNYMMDMALVNWQYAFAQDLICTYCVSEKTISWVGGWVTDLHKESKYSVSNVCEKLLLLLKECFVL